MTTATAEPVVDTPIACWRCGCKHMNSAARPWNFDCRRCHAHNESKPVAKN